MSLHDQGSQTISVDFSFCKRWSTAIGGRWAEMSHIRALSILTITSVNLRRIKSRHNHCQHDQWSLNTNHQYTCSCRVDYDWDHLKSSSPLWECCIVYSTVKCSEKLLIPFSKQVACPQYGEKFQTKVSDFLSISVKVGNTYLRCNSPIQLSCENKQKS